MAAAMSDRKRFKLRGITRNVVVLGWVSFFTDLASEMLYPIMPLFLVSLPGGSALLLGWIDGLAEGISSSLRWIGGALSDRFGKRRPFVFAGYTISAFSKPVMGLAAIAGWPLFLIGRCSDRLGKSIRTAARDALIADSTEAQYRGVAFGLHRAMDTAGAVLGPLMALGIVIAMVGWQTAFTIKAGHADSASGAASELAARLPLKWLFFIALGPGLISALLCITAVREIRPHDHDAGKPPAIFQHFPRPFWYLIIANTIFSLGNSSDSFLILRSGEVGLSFAHIILAFALYNTIYALTSTPLGKLSDHVGRKPVIMCGWTVYAFVYAGFAIFRSPWTPWILWAMYGLYQALTEGVTKAMVSDVVGATQRAGAIGLFYTVSGVGQLLASVVTGALWQIRILDQRIMLAFAVGAILALLAVPLIAWVPLRKEAR